MLSAAGPAAPHPHGAVLQGINRPWARPPASCLCPEPAVLSLGGQQPLHGGVTRCRDSHPDRRRWGSIRIDWPKWVEASVED